MKLDEFLNQNGLLMSDFAEKIGSTSATICRIIHGQTLPRRKLMEAIHRETRGLVTPNDLTGLHHPKGTNRQKGTQQ